MNNIIESHPFEPFLPEGAKILMLGTFPPAEHRWCMPFYYPNFQNDMWRIMGILFFDDKEHFIVKGEKRFNQQMIESFLREKGIAMYDTATKVVRTKNTASAYSKYYIDVLFLAYLSAVEHAGIELGIGFNAWKFKYLLVLKVLGFLIH